MSVTQEIRDRVEYLVRDAIGRGKHTNARIWWHVNQEWPSRRTGLRDSPRHVSRALQRMRKRGEIEFLSGHGWRVVESANV